MPDRRIAGDTGAFRAFSDYERGVLDGLRQALLVVHGHGMHDPPQARIRRLLACDECGHAPEKHLDGAECLERVRPPDARLLAACPCAEYEPRAFLLTSAEADAHG